MPFKEEIPNLTRWLQSRIDILDRDFSITPVERLAKYFQYQGSPMQFRGYEWQIGIINDDHPRQVVTKRSQVGLTTVMMLKVILFLEQYAFSPYWYINDAGVEMPLYPTAIYTLENDDKVREFSADRIKDLCRDNPYLEGLLEEGNVDQISLKKFGRAGLYLGGRKSISSVTTIPAQMVLGDEWDRTFDPDVGEQLESRLKASPMFRAKTQRGQMIIYSTPEMENAGVTKTYDEKSDQMVFMVKCQACNEWEEMTFPESIANFYEKGKKPLGELYYQCTKCYRPLDMAEIGKWDRQWPLKIHNCEWVPLRKEFYETVTRYGEGYRGYRVPWAYSTTANEVMNDRDNRTVKYFHHHVMGIPYADKKSGLTMALFKSIQKPELQFGHEPGYIHVMGVDQGAYAVIWRLIPGSRRDLVPLGRWQLVHAEFCPNAQAFKTWQTNPTDGTVIPLQGRMAKLMEQFGVVMCVIDAEPSGNDALNFQKDFLGKVFVNHSTKMNVDDPQLGFNWLEKETDPNGQEIYVGRISEDKTQAFDAYFDFIYSGNLETPDPARESEVEDVIKQHLNVKKTTTEKKKSFGRFTYETIYYAVGDDHYGNAGKFTYQAACLFHRLGYFNPTVILVSGQVSGVKMFQGRGK